MKIRLNVCISINDSMRNHKENKEEFIKNVAEQHKDKIPDKIYQAMMNWQIEITD